MLPQSAGALGAVRVKTLGGMASSIVPEAGFGGLGWLLPTPLAPSTGQAFYVATNGLDSNSGSLSAPWRTVQHALSTLSPGQIAYVRSGTYSQNLLMTRSGTLTAPITIRNYPGEQAILHPGGGANCNDALQLYDVSYVRVAGFTIEGANGCDNNTNVYVAGNSRHVEVSGNEIRNGHDHGLFADPGTLDVQVLANRVHDNGTIGSGNKDHALYMEGGPHLIANNLIYDHPFGHAVQIYPKAKGTIITNNTIVSTSYTSGYRAAGVIVGGDGLGQTADLIVIVNNIVAWNNYGLYGYYEQGGRGPQGIGNVGVDNLVYENAYGHLVNDRPYIINFSLGNLVADPLFVNREGYDFHLQLASPARGLALLGLTPPTNFDGDLRTIPPALGAF